MELRLMMHVRKVRVFRELRSFSLIWWARDNRDSHRAFITPAGRSRGKGSKYELKYLCSSVRQQTR